MNLPELTKLTHQDLLLQKELLESELQQLPSGLIACQKRGNSSRWYHRREDKTRHYIPKSRKTFASELAYKTYCQKQLLDVNQEIFALESYMRNHRYDTPRAEQLLEKSPEIRNLLSDRFSSRNEKMQAWMNTDYDKYQEYPEGLIVPTADGKFVRSKSEAIIAYCFHLNEVAYRYECALPLGDEVFYPDFTAYHKHVDKLLIWEHFGLLDDPDYLSRSLYKIRVYIKNGWIPGHNFIITTETKDKVLDFQQIPALVKYYFD